MDINNLPTGPSIPEGTLALGSGDTVTFIRRCDVCFAAILESHDADYAEHVQWHERTGTNLPPSD
ncbi:hypothetical protein WDJ51_05680 [Rathayibacter sp. YIM 133350]|uniref:hypothetical protein n=1 Tax=Rathayibacter sp. YIM 133350 TaxID=3131992 RepID=UPI00307DF529